MASARDKEKFFLSSLDVYVGGSAAGNLVAYTEPGSTLRQIRDVATAEGSVGGVRVPVRRDVIRNGAEFDGMFKQFDLDTMQMVMGGTILTGGGTGADGWSRLLFGSSTGLPAENKWAFKGERVDGKKMWLVIPAGQCLTPIETTVGGEEHASIPFTIGANICETTAYGYTAEDKNLYFWHFEVTAAGA